jgi:hypothetical protein
VAGGRLGTGGAPDDPEEAELDPDDIYDANLTPDPTAWLALDEQERIQRVEAWCEEAGIEAENLELHCMMLATVETQLALDAPPAVRETLARLVGEGLSRPAALRAIASELAQVMYLMATGGGGSADPNELYAERLARIDARAWRG